MFLSGKVQGVSFRFHAHLQAEKLGLKGWIRNLDDGRVEMIISGSANNLETMIAWARKGPPGAQVNDMKVSEVKDDLPDEPFFIRRDGGK